MTATGSRHEFDLLSREVIGIALAVHRALGPGFLESVYHRALRVGPDHRGVSYRTEHPVEICFEGVVVGRPRLDLVVGGALIVEVKAARALEPIHFAQLKSYLKATSIRIGLLMNFNAPTLTVKRLVLG